MTEEKQHAHQEELERDRVSADEVSWALRAVNRAAVTVDQELARRLRMRPLDYSAMTHLMGSTQAIGPAEVGERVGISSGSATELVDRLERDGHLVRARHPHDRRRVVLRPTEAAVAQVIHALQPLLTEMDQLAAQFTDEERSTIQRYLRAVEGHLNAFAEAPHHQEP